MWLCDIVECNNIHVHNPVKGQQLRLRYKTTSLQTDCAENCNAIECKGSSVTINAHRRYLTPPTPTSTSSRARKLQLKTKQLGHHHAWFMAVKYRAHVLYIYLVVCECGVCSWWWKGSPDYISGYVCICVNHDARYISMSCIKSVGVWDTKEEQRFVIENEMPSYSHFSLLAAYVRTYSYM